MSASTRQEEETPPTGQRREAGGKPNRFWGTLKGRILGRCGRSAHRLALRVSYASNAWLLTRALRLSRLDTPGRRAIVVSQVVHMGDIVACEPVIRHIRQKNPEAFIVWAVERRYRELADSHPAVDYTLPVECPTEWIYFAQSRLLDRVVDLNISGRSCPICGIRWFPKAGTYGINYDNYLREGSLLAAYSISAGLARLSDAPKLYIGNGTRAEIGTLRLPEQFATVHCAANERVRMLPVSTWEQIARYMIEAYGIPVVELGLKAYLRNRVGEGYLNLCGRLSILESAETIRRSLIYIGTDSGPAHVANAVGTYGIIVLGSYHVFRSYTPYSGDYGERRNCELVRYDGPVHEIPVESIFRAIDRRMETLGVGQRRKKSS